MLSSQQCHSRLLSASLDPYLSPQAASIVFANKLDTCSLARTVSIMDLTQIYGAFKLLEVPLSQPSSLDNADLWGTEKLIVVSVLKVEGEIFQPW